VAEAKALAVRSGQTLREVVEDALRESQARRELAIREPAAELPTFAGSKRASHGPIEGSDA